MASDRKPGAKVLVVDDQDDVRMPDAVRRILAARDRTFPVTPR